MLAEEARHEEGFEQLVSDMRPLRMSQGDLLFRAGETVRP